MNNYAYPEVLVETQWVAENLTNPSIRFIEVDIDASNYDTGHLHGAIFWNGLQTLLCSDYRVNFDKEAVENLLSRSGITNDTTIIVYSGQPGVAPWVFWFLKGFGHCDVRVMNGGRKKWLAEGRQVTTKIPTIMPTEYNAKIFDQSIRVECDAVLRAITEGDSVLLDVRTPQEYSGEWFTMEPPSGTERAGHIPGAVHLYYEEAHQEDETFKPVEELKALYDSKGITGDKAVITYCAVGMRAAHTWFVLRYLLGHQNVRNYDASWSEWGLRFDTPIEQ
jgi:thiosulfate/3-mercaptopyruvate sulfurtransferase